MKKYIPVGVFICILSAFLVMPYLNRQKPTAEVIPIDIPELIEVNLSGEVNMPGVYYVAYGTTYQQLFSYALGLKSTADLANIDLYQPIESNLRIIIQPITSQDTQKININLATKEQLMSLPSIGAITAERIITYRQTNGSFSSIDALMNVSGIGESTFEKLKAFITV